METYNKKELKERINKYIADNPNTYTSEISEAFPEYETVVILILLDELKDEGKII